MANETDILCDVVRDLYADGLMVSVYGTLCISSFAAILPAFALCLAIARASALHRNIRLLLVSVFISTILSNVGKLIVAGYHVRAILFSKSNDELCDMVALTGRSCTRLQSLSAVGSFTITTSAIFLAIERICATVLFKTYENNRGRKLGIFLCIAQWLMAIPGLPLFGDVNRRYPYCDGAVVDPRASQAVIAFMLIVQSAGLVVFVVLVRVNNRKILRYTFNSALKLLSVRYQLKENVNTTMLMIPISVASCFFYTVSLVVLYVSLDDIPENPPLTATTALMIISYGRSTEFLGFATPIHTLILCAIVLRSSKHIRQAALKLIGRRRIIKVSPFGMMKNGRRNTAFEVEQTRKLYFDALKEQWG